MRFVFGQTLLRIAPLLDGGCTDDPKQNSDGQNPMMKHNRIPSALSCLSVLPHLQNREDSRETVDIWEFDGNFDSLYAFNGSVEWQLP